MIECVPTGSEDVVSVAVPLALSMPPPSEVVVPLKLSENVTVPVARMPDTVAVNVTGVPGGAVF